MGGGSSSYFHTETPEEIQERSRIVRLQDQACEYVKNVLYYGVSIRTGRKPHSKIEQIWIEPQPELLEEALKNQDTANLDLLNCAPSGVLIDTKSNVKILFTMEDVEYTMKAQDILDYWAAKKKINTVTTTLVAPGPPELEKATSSTLALKWDKQLPFPIGIIQKIEVQYAQIEVDSMSKSYKWSTLISKFYNNKHMLDHVVEVLQPGLSFRYRLRYYCDAGWSEYSDSSPVYSTLPDRPSRPGAPECVAITPTAVELQWAEHTRDNGSAIIAYILRGRSVGDSFVVLYTGMDFSHLELGIFPEYAYCFQLIVVNGIGESDPSSIVTVKTPQKPRERTPDMHKGFDMRQITLSVQCKDAWKECWDPKTEQVFYFNKILGTRQLNKPQVMQEDEEEEDSEVTAEKKKKALLKLKEAEFRKKRYRLLRALHKNKHSVMTAAATRQSRGSLDGIAPLVSSLVYDSFVLDVAGNGGASAGAGGGGGTNNSPVAASTASARTPTSVSSSSVSGGSGGANMNKPLFIDLKRELMLPDCITAFSKMGLVDFYRRFKVTFAGEAGIDSGGLSKEAFLLLSKQAALYAGPLVHKWMVPLKGVEKNGETGAALEVEGFFFESNNAIKAFDQKREEANSKTTLLVNPNKVASTNALTANAINVLDYEVGVTSEKFSQYLGKLLGKALFDRQLIDFPLSPLLLQHMIGGLPFENKVNSTGNIVNRGKNTTDGVNSLRNEVNQMLVDIKDIDEVLYKTLHWIANNNITDIIYETFSVVDGDMTLPLCASGDTKDVSEDNKFEYIQLMILWKTKYSISNSLFPFLASFHEFIPVSILKECAISKQELNLILNGKSTVDVEELRAYCIYEADDLEEFNETSDVVVWFWRLFRELSDAERRVLLKFFTGSSRVPLDGYDPPLNITQGCEYMKEDSLPMAHTCFNQIVLPNYSSYQICKDKVLFAMKNSEGFDLA